MGIFIEILVNTLSSSPIWTAITEVIWSWMWQPWKNTCNWCITRSYMIEEHWGNASLSALVARMLYEVFAFKHMVSVSHKAKRSPQIAMISKQPWQLSSWNNGDIYTQGWHMSESRCLVTKLHIQNYGVSHRFTIQTPEALTWICHSLY